MSKTLEIGYKKRNSVRQINSAAGDFPEVRLGQCWISWGEECFSSGLWSSPADLKKQFKISVAEPDPGSGVFLTPGSGIRDG
jgi:hypothetical protein